MGKRSQSQTRWPKRHDTPVKRMVRQWVCADCRKPTQLITCADGKQRCHAHKEKFDRQHEALREAARRATATILPAGQIVYPPRVG